MNNSDAANIVAYLNAGFPRDALEAESTAIWITEVADLAHPQAGLDAARSIVRGGDRFPTIREYRQAYRAAFDRLIAGRALEEPYEAVPPPPEAAATLDRLRNGTVLRSFDDAPPIPPTTSMRRRPVYARWIRRETGVSLLPPSDEEKADAIIILRDYEEWLEKTERTLGYKIEDPVFEEAQRILDEASV